MGCGVYGGPTLCSLPGNLKVGTYALGMFTHDLRHFKR